MIHHFSEISLSNLTMKKDYDKKDYKLFLLKAVKGNNRSSSIPVSRETAVGASCHK